MKLSDIELKALQNDYRCHFCNAPLRNAEAYEHSGGITLEDFDNLKMWVYFPCPNPKCHYDWALWKLLKRW